MVYRVEFTNTLNPEAAPNPNDPLGGGNELLWQLTFGTETMKVTKLTYQTPFGASTAAVTTTVLADNIPVLPNNHGPQTDRSIYGLNPSSTEPFLVNYSGDGRKSDVFGKY